MAAQQTWQEWAAYNCARGCDENQLRSILLSEGFSETEAKSFLGSSLESTEVLPTTAEIPHYDKPKALKQQISLHNAVAIENESVELYAVENFLNEEECSQIIRLIREDNSRSTTTEDGISDFRTSSTCDFANFNHPLIDEIDRRICQYMGIKAEESETIQGQLYEVGQQFKAHTDYFQESTSSINDHVGQQGQRSWTFMIYLNTTREGGVTDFTNLDLSIKPTSGTAVIWNNRLPDGSCNPDTVHCGSPVVSGYKAILTKWFRSKDAGHEFCKEDNEVLPALTRNGFMLTDVPEKTYQHLSDYYHSHRENVSKEDIPQFIQSDSSIPPSQLIELPTELKARVHNDLQPIVESWIGDYVIPTHVYGIREYRHSAVLKMHRDRLNTHIASAIINIDQSVNRDWALIIEDHFYRQHKVYLKPGQMLFYEGAKLRHGRPISFDGDSYANVFVHYKL